MEEPTFIDADAYTSNDKNQILNFRIIVLTTLQKIQGYSACEWIGGYWKTVTKIANNAMTQDKVYEPDTREIYSNSIEYLHDLLHARFDAEMMKASEKAMKALEKAYNDTTIVKELDNEQPDKELRIFETDNNKITFRSKRREISRILFRDLCDFLFRKKYLELGSVVD